MAKKGWWNARKHEQHIKQTQKCKKMSEMQEELEAKEIEVSVGGGAVTVKVNGKKKL